MVDLETVKQSAAALEEASRTVGKAIDAGRDVGRFAGRVLGDLPENLVGLSCGDWLREQRIRNRRKLRDRTEEILRDRGRWDQAETISPSLAIPILEKSQDETREEIVELWSRLLAAAADPERKSAVRQSFTDTLQKIEPDDALVMNVTWFGIKETKKPNHRLETPEMSEELGVGHDAITISYEHLQQLGIMTGKGSFTPYGRELMRACDSESDYSRRKGLKKS